MENITKNAERKINETVDKVFPNADAAIGQAKEKGGAAWDKAKEKGRDLLGEVELRGQLLGKVGVSQPRLTMNSSETTPSTGRLLFGLAKDHLELASLEWQFQKKLWGRRLLIRASGVTFFLTAYIFFHIALVAGLLRLGMSALSVGLLLGLAYAALGATVFLMFKPTEEEKEELMSETKSELKRSLEWIEKNFL